MPRDLFGQPIAPRASDIRMEVEFGLVGRARLWLRYVWDEDMPAAAFLMNNPSIAGGDDSPFDQTAKRTIHFAHTHGCGSVWLVNWCPLIATHPADLWKMLAGGGEEWWQKREHWQRVNGLAVERAGRAASIRVVACGPDGFRRPPIWCAGRCKRSSGTIHRSSRSMRRCALASRRKALRSTH